MAKQVTLADKLLARLQKLGLNKRKATDLAKKLAPSVARQPVRGTVTEKLTQRLMKLGLKERKAAELAKSLAPLVRASIKAKAKAKALALSDVTDDMVNDTVTQTTDEAEDAELDKVAPRVNGHRVRLDLPVVERSRWQASPVRGVELLRVMDGLTSRGTYLVAAVKGETGIVAIRQLDPDTYNVKFYPDMAFWKVNQEMLAEMGAVNHLTRDWYERMHVSRAVLTPVLAHLHKQARPKITQMLKRYLSVTAGPLLKAFGFLHTREISAA